MTKNSGSTSQQLKRERRTSPRAQIELIIEYSDLEHFCQDYASNLSLGGIFIDTRNPLPVGSVIALNFSLPGYEGQIRTSGRVVRVQAPEAATNSNLRAGMAVQFDDLSEENKGIIDALVRRSLDDF